MKLSITYLNKDYSLKLEKYLKSLPIDQQEELMLSRYGRKFTVEEVIELLRSEYRVFVALENDKIIGIADLSKAKEEGYYELGYMVFPDYQKRGYGYELVKYVFENPKILKDPKKIKAEAEITNIASQRLLEKISGIYPPIKVEINASYTPNTKIYYWIL